MHLVSCQPVERGLPLSRLMSCRVVSGLMFAFASAVALAEAPYDSTWESLSGHQIPAWFRDAKFGVYTHWGPSTVATADAPGKMGWYARQMYGPKGAAIDYHRKRFGDPGTVGYKDIVPLFTAKSFDADEWAELFLKAGARFAGPVAIHHDNFAMWDSALTEWDSVDKSPHRDVTGELETAIRKRGMKFIATFHHGFSWRYYEPAYAFDAADPKYAGLYCTPHKPGAPPSRGFQDRWLGKVNEVVQKYAPDLIWFDFGLARDIAPEYQRRMFADYYNWAARNGRDVAVAHKHSEIHKHTGLIDHERGRESRLVEHAWLTDTSIGPWFHCRALEFKTTDQLVDVLVDIVSKNGCLLLNVGPDADGSIPPVGKELLSGIGRWLDVNGEAIYDTRPWAVFGEGPTLNAGGFKSEHQDQPFSCQDLRFTRSKDGEVLHVIALGWPEKKLAVQSLRVDLAAPNARIELLGHGDASYQVDNHRLMITPPRLDPEQRPCKHAFVFKLTGFSVSLRPEARFDQPDAICLLPQRATIEGREVQVAPSGDRWRIRQWNNAHDRVHWVAWVEKPGTYAVRAEVRGNESAVVGLTLDVAGQSATAQIRSDARTVDMGQVTFDQPGVHHFVLRPTDPDTWRRVDVWKVQMARME
jgi:alpha-L-fucosidase